MTSFFVFDKSSFSSEDVYSKGKSCHLKGEYVISGIKDRLQGSLLGVRIGDALGMPVETMEPLAIQEVTNMQGITGFVDAIQKRLKEQSEFKAGDATDDWQLTRTVAESLIAVRGYSQEHMARSHVAAMRTCTSGWGHTTRVSVKELEEYFISNGQRGRKPSVLPTPKPKQGGGNGIAMKIAPIPFAVLIGNFAPERPEETIFHWTDQLGALTHSHEDAMYTAYAVALTMYACIGHPLKTQQDSKWFLDWLKNNVQHMAWRSKFYRPDTGEDMARATVNQLLKLNSLIGHPERLRQEITPTYTAIESVPYALGVFLTYPNDARKALLTCVNDGLDTDTTAAICGSLLGANGGVEVFPEEWRNFRPDFKEPLDLGEKLYQAFARSSQQTA